MPSPMWYIGRKSDHIPTLPWVPLHPKVHRPNIPILCLMVEPTVVSQWFFFCCPTLLRRHVSEWLAWPIKTRGTAEVPMIFTSLYPIAPKRRNYLVNTKIHPKIHHHPPSQSHFNHHFSGISPRHGSFFWAMGQVSRPRRDGSAWGSKSADASPCRPPDVLCLGAQDHQFFWGWLGWKNVDFGWIKAATLGWYDLN